MELLTRLIIFLIRKKLNLKKCQDFYFTNQKAKNDRYYFTDTSLMKYSYLTNTVNRSNVSLSYLLSDECSIQVENSGDWIKRMLRGGKDSNHERST